MIRAGRPRPERDQHQAELFEATLQELGLDPEDLAAILGTHLRTIYRWKGNERAIPPHLWLLLALRLIRVGKRARALTLPVPEAGRVWLR